MPYPNGVLQIKRYFTANNVTASTAKHSHVVSVGNTALPITLSFPGYKYRPGVFFDYLVQFEYNGTQYSISHSDIALDIYQKVIDNPTLLADFRNFIVDIGVNGLGTAIPGSLLAMTSNPPLPQVIQHVQTNVTKNRLTPLPFGIPISDYPSILFWASLNEEINYHPTMNSAWGARRTAYKKYCEAALIAEYAVQRNAGGIHANDLKNVCLIIERVKAGKVSPLNPLPAPYQQLFTSIDNYIH